MSPTIGNPLARSLSLRLLAIFTLTAFVLVALLAGLFTQGLSSQWQRSIRPHLVQYVRYVQDDLGSPPDPARARALAAALPVTIAIHRDGRLVATTDPSARDLHRLSFRPLPREVQRRLRQSPATADIAGSRSDTPPIRAAIARERRREGTVLRIERGTDTTYYRFEAPRGQRVRRADGLYLALTLTVLVLLASYLLIRRQLVPIGHIQRGVARMSEGELDHRIAPSGQDDLATLGRSIDEMAARIGAMLDAKRQLLLAISHELRSPLARARIATEMLDPSRERERIEADLADMAHLIEELTESERLRTPHSALHRERLDLVALLTEELSAHALTPTLLDLPDDGLPILADATRLRMLIRNLVGNALRHGRPIGERDNEENARRTGITVTLSIRGPSAVLRIADRGPGIDPEHLERITEPFYRPDSARTRQSGGIGLGLSLARLVAEAHGGTLAVESDPATTPGTRVTVTLPRETAHVTAGPSGAA